MTDFSQEALEIASALGGLTYVIGALIYALPIPFRGLKDWGPTLMGDGIYVAFWTAFYSAIISFVNQISPPWHSYLSWLYGTTAELGNLYTVVYGVSGVLAEYHINYAPLSLASFFLSSAAAIFLYLLSFSLLIYENWELFIVLGIMLMAIPFRIGRSAGATLIAFAVVFYIGLPFFPTLNLNSVFSALAGSSSPESAIQQSITNNIANFIFDGMAYFIVLILASVTLADLIGNYSGKLPLGISVVF